MTTKCFDDIQQSGQATAVRPVESKQQASVETPGAIIERARTVAKQPRPILSWSNVVFQRGYWLKRGVSPKKMG
ncbi:MAG: hypothetical protein MI924_20025 [Chloroflexales bacterium]|nr:hypothetical protein [Chloroflexales bacterium]